MTCVFLTFPDVKDGLKYCESTASTVNQGRGNEKVLIHADRYDASVGTKTFQRRSPCLKKMYNLLLRLSLIYNFYLYPLSLPLKTDTQVFGHAHPPLVPIKSLIFICRCLQETMCCISKMFSM